VEQRRTFCAIPVLDRDSYLRRGRAPVRAIDQVRGSDRGRMADRGLVIDRSRELGPLREIDPELDRALAIDPLPITVRIGLRIVASGGRVGRNVAARFWVRFTIIRFGIFGEIIRCGERGRSRGRGDGRLGVA
jgi:hypothetical protein